METRSSGISRRQRRAWLGVALILWLVVLLTAPCQAAYAQSPAGAADCATTGLAAAGPGGVSPSEAGCPAEATPAGGNPTDPNAVTLRTFGAEAVFAWPMAVLAALLGVVMAAGLLRRDLVS
jgi:hypothetical protein